MQHQSTNNSPRSFELKLALLGKITAILAICLISSPSFAHDEVEKAKEFRLDDAAIAFPLLDGWQQDNPPADSTAIVLRLVKNNPLVGAPRIDFYVEPKKDDKTSLKQLINDNLRSMASQEKAKQIRITYRDQRNVTFNSIAAVRLRYDYTLISSQNAVISQVNYFFDRGDRLVMITAFGISELYLPISNEIETMIEGIVPIVPGIKGRIEPIATEAQSFFKPRQLALPDMITRASEVYKGNCKPKQIVPIEHVDITKENANNKIDAAANGITKERASQGNKDSSLAADQEPKAAPKGASHSSNSKNKNRKGGKKRSKQ